MKVVPPVLVAAALCLFGPAAPAADRGPACAADPHAPGIQGRIANLRNYMVRIERSVDLLEQRRLLAIHLKVMGEGMRELRKDGTSEACRAEMMHALMEQMLLHQLAEQEARER